MNLFGNSWYHSHSVLSFISLVLSGLTDVRNPKIPIIFSLKSLIFALKKFFVYFPCTSNVSDISLFSKTHFNIDFHAWFVHQIKHESQFISMYQNTRQTYFFELLVFPFLLCDDPSFRLVFQGGIFYIFYQSHTGIAHFDR